MVNEKAEIRVDTTIKADVRIENNRPDLFVWDRGRTLVEVGITNQDLVNITENDKLRRYGILTDEISLPYKVKIIPFVLSWDGVRSIEAYMQSVEDTLDYLFRTET
jgi:hypothetical protein